MLVSLFKQMKYHKSRNPMDILALVIMVVYFLIPCVQVSVAADSIGLSQSIRDNGTTLVSQGGSFELGFFSPGNSNKRYLGIWYKNIPIQTVVWVANRVNPINDSSGILTVNATGNLVLRQSNTVVWYTALQNQAQNPVVELLDNGNLVVKNEADLNAEDYLWQSFDHPCDTFMQGMKLGWDIKKGLDWQLTSWKSPDDPSPGDLSFSLVLHNYPEYYMMKGTQKLYRVGPWNGVHFSGLPYPRPNPIYDFRYVTTKDEIYGIFSLKNNSIISRVVLNQTGDTINRYGWMDKDQTWRVFETSPRDDCDTYGFCGAYGNCILAQPQICHCLQGFSPKSMQEWISSDWTHGCVRNKPLSCDSDGFVTLASIKVPDTTNTLVDDNIGLQECRDKCLKNCSCMAYTNSDISGQGSGCVMWFGDLNDIKQVEDGGQDIYIRMPASELGPDLPQHRRKKNITVIVATSTTIAAIGLVLSLFIIYRIRRNIAERSKTEDNNEVHGDDLDLPLFDLPTITTATNDFLEKNKIGEGGFGPVYWGKLADGQEIAVKRLSQISGQGMNEFLNEVKLIAKLQHRNLVKLLGCCIQGQEKLLVYEYMVNGSLDSFIFGINYQQSLG